MSTIRKTPEKAVPSLLARLSKTKEHALKVVSGRGDDTHRLASKFESIESTLQHMKESLIQIKNWETMVVEQLGVLDQVLDDEIFSFEHPSQVSGRVEQIDADVGKLKSLVSMVDQSVSRSPGGINSENQPLNNDAGQKTSNLAVEDKILESEAKSFLSEIFHCLESSQLKKCLVLLSVYPENKAIKKRPLIYWWIGEGLVTQRSNATAEEVGEEMFQELLNHSIINKSITTNSFTVYPWIRRLLIQLAEKNSFLEFSPEATPRNACGRAFLWRGNKDNGEKQEDLVTVYNMNEQYLGSSLDLLSKRRKLEVLQMGRWQDSATHHIEAKDYEKLLETLGSQKQLKYVSLRGISRIETLHRSIQNLKRLLILDLKACHNLNKLPDEVGELRSLTHLDVSECYLLDSMPKKLQGLSNLQVLKGFVLSNSCNINDLAQLPHLRKLSIRVGNQQQLGSLADFGALRILTITWRVVTSDDDTVVSLPTALIKLDLRSVPFNSVPQWMEPSKLPNLKKLYIKGGKLTSLNSHKYVNVKFISLSYLKGLQMSQQDLVDLFPDYRYLQITKCHDQDQIQVLERAG